MTENANANANGAANAAKEITWGEVAKKVRDPSEVFIPRSTTQSLNVRFAPGSVIERPTPGGFTQYLIPVEALDATSGQWLSGKKLVVNKFQLGDILGALNGPPPTGVAFSLKMTGEGEARKLGVLRASP